MHIHSACFTQGKFSSRTTLAIQFTVNGPNHTHLPTFPFPHRINPFLYWKPIKGSLANSADPDQMPHNVVAGQGLHCLLTQFFIKI